MFFIIVPSQAEKRIFLQGEDVTTGIHNTSLIPIGEGYYCCVVAQDDEDTPLLRATLQKNPSDIGKWFLENCPQQEEDVVLTALMGPYESKDAFMSRVDTIEKTARKHIQNTSLPNREIELLGSFNGIAQKEMARRILKAERGMIESLLKNKYIHSDRLEITEAGKKALLKARNVVRTAVAYPTRFGCSTVSIRENDETLVSIAKEIIKDSIRMLLPKTEPVVVANKNKPKSFEGMQIGKLFSQLNNRISRAEIAAWWFFLFGRQMNEEYPTHAVSTELQRLLQRSSQRGKLTALCEKIAAERPDIDLVA